MNGMIVNVVPIIHLKWNFILIVSTARLWRNVRHKVISWWLIFSAILEQRNPIPSSQQYNDKEKSKNKKQQQQKYVHKEGKKPLQQ